ncbi:hypothetical protein EDEG_00133 [Edhazardia aedis USNM 41457]|uniref:Hsp70-like protein n=1 Tax=Edhazardia aedis (strain USNM 41457) TaxID=1003232 RepID=J9DPF8_EDHAE|nr:hypothetical protein EDEG_00133 [Edhazardia aedis USNM 41457]|eukprot:EJW04430.1 hypothetical protein EDEG_00133 [Edhazardia aedis USNM 41457]
MKGSDLKSEKDIMVFDLGGGTFDVSVLRLSPVKPDEDEIKSAQSAGEEVQTGILTEVLGTDGDTFLGGLDFDNVLLDYVLEKWSKDHPTLKVDEKGKRRLMVNVERAKRGLSSATMVQIDLDCFVSGVDLHYKVSRALFEERAKHLFRKCMDRVKGCMLTIAKGKPEYDSNGFLMPLSASDQSKLDSMKNRLEKIILVGGSSRIPKIIKDLAEYFGEEKLCYSVHPDEAVAMGAAYQAAMIAGDSNMGGKDMMLLLDACAFSIGIETQHGVMTPIIEKNTTIPCKKSQQFTTAADNQTAVTITIYEGERTMAKDNHLLGQFNLEGIPPAPRGSPQIEVCMEMTQEGILTVTAMDKSTSKHQSIEIKNTAGKLPKEEIERMRKDAERYAREDAEVKLKIDARCQLESTLFRVKSCVDQVQVDAAIKTELKNKLNEVELWMNTNKDASVEEIKAKEKMIEEYLSEITKRAAGSQAGSGSSQGAGAGPTVEEVD